MSWPKLLVLVAVIWLVGAAIYTAARDDPRSTVPTLTEDSDGVTYSPDCPTATHLC